MTLGSVTGCDSSSAVSFCSCCGAKMVPDLGEDTVVSKNQINQLISESFLTVKGAALFLPRGKSPTPTSEPQANQRRSKHTGDLQKHLQTMFTLLRPEDTIRLAVRLESAYPQVTRYMVVVSTNGRQDTEESIVLGMDFVSSDSCCTVGLVLPLWSDTMIHLDGDGGFSVSTVNRVHVFKPVSVQAMWSALQSLHKACEVARCHNYYPGSLFLTWVSYYQSRVSSGQFCINEWNAMQDVESHRANSPVLFTDLPTERERTERLIKMRLREIMMQKDLENVTCKEIRTELEMQMVCNLREFKEFIDNEMIVILGQMDSPTEIFDHVFLGSEWNASNLEELQNSGVRYILNVTREIDNFFPGMFEYHNIRVYDEEATNLLEYWNDTYKFITKAKKAGAKCLVHCKMGVSRSASTVIAYAMKEYGWDLDTAFDYVKERRAVTKPNPSFMKQLEEYQGILLASKQRHNKLWRSHSDSELSERADPTCRAPCLSLGRTDTHNNNTIPAPSLHHLLGVAVLQALGAEPAEPDGPTGTSALPNGVCEVVVLAGVRVEPEEPAPQPPPQPLPRPRAATVIPEERPDSPASVAYTTPVAAPLPPPALLILPPTPEPQRAHRSLRPTHLSIPQPLSKRTNLALNSPGSPRSDDPVLTPVVSEGASELDPSLSAPVTPKPPPNDDNNNPNLLLSSGDSERRGEADGLAASDSINFSSAREKFLGLALDGPPKTAPSPDGEAEVSKQPEEEQQQGDAKSLEFTSPENDRAAQQMPPIDSMISVRHIVTEIEAISNPPASPLRTSPPSSFSSPSTPPSQNSPHLPLEHPEEAGPPKSPLGPSPPPTGASLLPSERPAGSVRRATEQLEQRMKQESATAPRSPLHSPSAEQPAVRLSASSPEFQTKDREQAALQKTRSSFSDRLSSSSSRDNTHSSTTGCAPTPGAGRESFQDTSGPAPATVSPKMVVHGVTVQESDTDKKQRAPLTPLEGCGSSCPAQSRLARSSQELERIQETLRELQAFLHEGAGPGCPRDAMDTEPEFSNAGGSFRSPLRELVLSQRRDGRSLAERTAAVELQARLRQAGLTPPSLMKRSASLAKLDFLELSANDLNDLDLSPSPGTAPLRQSSAAPAPQFHPDDSLKKQKVLAQLSGHRAAPCPSTLPKEDRGEREDLDGGGASRAPSKGHGRRSRKAAEKKRAAALLYNTM